MKTTPSIFGFSRTVTSLLGAVWLTVTLFISGCATAVKVESTPPGAAVSIGGKSLGNTPTQYQVENAAKPVDVNFSLPGYFPKTITYTAGSNAQPIIATLAPTTLNKSFDLATNPAGAAVTLDGKAAGTTPATLPIVFRRNSENGPWIPQRVALSKTNYQTEPVVLTADLGSVPTVKMELLKDERVYNITAATLEGKELKDAPVTLDGVAKGKTPLKLPITYERTDKSRPWPKFTVSIEMPTLYKQSTTELNYTRDTNVALKLEDIKEIPVKIYTPAVTLETKGATFTMQERTTLGVLDTSDSAAVTDLKQVTKYPRQDILEANRVETINSYTVTPDGQNVIFSLSEAEPDGTRYSVLKIKPAADSAGGISALTKGTRNFDTQPFMARDDNNYNLVFTTNRSDRNKSDIYLGKLTDGKIEGNPSRLTSDSRFNFYPTYGNSARLLYYLSMEPGYTKAETQLWNSEFNGTKASQMSYVAEQINNTHMAKILYVKKDKETQKQVIYWINADGTSETALITDESYRKFNCFNPYFSADGKRVLFVSNRTSGGKDERSNNNIYIINSDGSNLQQLTTNESDDTLPQWSPTEDDVIYFLSTRGGAANIWRFKLVSRR